MRDEASTLIGHIIDVQGGSLIASLTEDEQGESPAVTIGDEDILVGQIGSYVEVRQGSLKLLALLTRMSEQEKLAPPLPTPAGEEPTRLPFANRTVWLVPIGTVTEKGEFERVGSSETRQASVRVLAASNKDLQAAIQKGEFREDLYYRLNVFPITLPPLRERKEDIPLLSNYFLHKYAAKFKKEIDTIPPAVMKELISYSWPGNVRELANIIERAVIVARLPGFQIDKLLEVHNHDSLPGTRSDKLANIEREHILQVLEKTNWIIEGNRGAAVRLGLNPGTLRSRMQKLGITRPL